MFTRQHFYPTLFLLLVLSSGGCRDVGPPHSPEEALKTIRLPEGFRIELVAVEPQVVDPVAMEFDEHGRLYVVEMSDYPLGNRSGRIKLLEDHNGDGRFESATVFAENIDFPNGLMPWKDGILVTAAPDILYLADTDGDQRADVRKVLLTGFAATNPQLRVNGLAYGLDNWIYVAYPRASGSRRYGQFGDLGQAVRFPEHPDAGWLEIAPGNDFRFRLDAGRGEAAGGMSQFGNAFDQWGNRFTVWNNDHIRHVVVEARYLSRNPYLAASQLMQAISDHGSAATLYPITDRPFHLHESEIGHFTSACGTSVYTGGSFPEEYQEAYFVCDPVHNVVHCDVLTPDGISFSATRARRQAEFLSSTDSWFRPVYTTLGPDGALYVVDFHRKLVEHPEFIPEADDHGFYVYQGILSQDDFLEGRQLGRIYRIVPDTVASEATPPLANVPSSELVRQLASSNMWLRTTAQRLLVDRQDMSAAPALSTTARQGKSPQARAHALWTLQGLGESDEKLVLDVLGDEDANVRRQAVRLAEEHLSSPDVQRKLLGMVHDSDVRVQFQLALALGGIKTTGGFNASRQLLLLHLENPWFQTAILSGASDSAIRWLRATKVDLDRNESQQKVSFVRKMASIVGGRARSREVSSALMMVGGLEGGQREWWRAAALAGLAEGLEGAAAISLPAVAEDLLVGLSRAPSRDIRRGALDVMARIELSNASGLQSELKRALVTVGSHEAVLEDRVDAARLLGLDPSGSGLPKLVELVAPAQPAEVRLAAATALARGRNAAQGTTMLLENWHSYTAPIKELVLDSFFESPARLGSLLDAMEAGEIQPWSLDRSSRSRLLRFPDSNLRERAKVLLAELVQEQSSYTEIFKTFHLALQLAGDVEEGHSIFEQRCGGCHRVSARGTEVGPDLTSLSRRTKQYFLREIIDPNKNITPGYEQYSVETRDGRVITGVLAEDAPAVVTLRRRGGDEDTILRTNIKSLRGSSVSQMPDDLTVGMSVRDMADLLVFLDSM